MGGRQNHCMCKSAPLKRLTVTCTFSVSSAMRSEFDRKSNFGFLHRIWPRITALEEKHG